MEIEQVLKYPKRQLIKLLVDNNIITWQEGWTKTRDELLKLIEKI